MSNRRDERHAKIGLALLVGYAAYNLATVTGAAAPLPVVGHGIACGLGLAVGLLLRRPPTRRPEPAPATPASDLLTVRRLVSVIDAGDPFTRGRSLRVSRFSVEVGRRLGLDERELSDLECAALLHDIGRVAIHRDVLLKPTELDGDERATVHNHAQVGCDMLRDIPPLSRAAEIVLAHHEQPDGKGYPRGLSGKGIPVESRILMVTAAFEAMTSDRPYRRGLSPEAAYRELRDCAGTMFFGDVVEAFIELHESGRIFAGFSPEDLALVADDDGALPGAAGQPELAPEPVGTLPPV